MMRWACSRSVGGGLRRLQNLRGIAQRRERVAQFVREHGEEFILAAIRPDEVRGVFRLGILQRAALGNVREVADDGRAGHPAK